MIPKIFHFIWIGDGEPQNYRNSWQEFNPDWKIQQWNEDLAIRATGANVTGVKNEWVKSMILRLSILKQFGGVYCDYDLKCIRSCKDIAEQGSSGFVIKNESDFIKHRIHPPDSNLKWSMMGFTSGHPFLNEVLSYIGTPNIVHAHPSSSEARRVYQSFGKLFDTSQWTNDILVLPRTTVASFKKPALSLTIACHCMPSRYSWRNHFHRFAICVEIWLHQNHASRKIMISFLLGFIIAFFTMIISDIIRMHPKYKFNKVNK